MQGPFGSDRLKILLADPKCLTQSLRKEVLRDFNPICAVSYNAYLMTPPFLDLLRRIVGGGVIHGPVRRDAEGLREFQDKERFLTRLAGTDEAITRTPPTMRRSTR